MSLESAAVFFKSFSAGKKVDDATATFRRLGVMFSLLSLEGMMLVLRKRDIVDDRMTGRRRGRQRVTAEMLLVEDIPQAYTHQHTLLQRGSFLFAICKAF